MTEKEWKIIFSLLGLMTLMGVTGCDSTTLDFPAGITIEKVLDEADPRVRAEGLLAYFESARGEDLSEIQLAYTEAYSRIDLVSATIFAQWWVQFDPVGAYNDGVEKAWIEPRLWASAVYREWARIAPEAAIRSAMTIPADSGQEWRRYIALAVVQGSFDGSIGDARPLLELILRLPFGRPQKESLDVLLVRLIEKHGTEYAASFVEDFPPELGKHLKADAFKRMATVLTQDDPALGVAWVEKHGSGPFGKNLAVRVGRMWGRTGGEPAVEWAKALPEDFQDRDRVLVQAFRGWSGRDQPASQAWLDRQPKTMEYAPLFKIEIEREARQNPAEAIARAEKIEDPALRSVLLAEAGHIWINLDRDAANAWLANAKLSSAAEAYIRKPLRGQPKLPPSYPTTQE